MNITITQTGTTDGGFTANIQFDDGPPHPVIVHDPFSPEEEARLGWYFEEWLTFPFTGHVRASEAAASVSDYGHHLFQQLFQGETLIQYRIASQNQGVADFSFAVRGDPAFHALHWEALKDPQQQRPFTVEALFVRPNIQPAQNYIQPQPSPTLNILLVTARPGGQRDVSYRTISRPLVTALRNSQLRAQIDLVRPGSFAALVQHLEAARDDDKRGDGYYHIIHFDLHGSLLTYEQYQQLEPANFSHHLLRGYGQPDLEPYAGYKAFLAFNGAEPGQVDLVSDEAIADLLARHRLPIAILNACQSGKQVGETETSLGSRLMAAGVQTAVAMGYSVSVSAAERLMTALYGQLLAGQPLAQAIRRARLELYNDKNRRAAYEQTIQLEDWLLPVVYQNRVSNLTIIPFTSPDEEAAYWESQSRRYRAPDLPYGFLGRDVDILQIENRLLGEGEAAEGANILLIQGMGGTGKTTLLRHLMEWWQTTRLVAGVFYFGYDERAYNTAQIVDSLARQLYGAEYGHAFSPLPEAAKIAKLTARLRGERHLLVLDNLESITGTALAIQHTLDEAEQGRLRDFVAGLAGGRTLVLLGSRGKEEWLVGRFSKSPYELGGLDPEAASQLAKQILTRIGKADLLKTPELTHLLKLLDGYPLALEVILPNLKRQNPADLLAAFTGGKDGVDVAAGGELWQDKTASILRCVEYSHSNLSPEAQALLTCLFPFTGVINAEGLPQYSEQLQQQAALADLPYEQWAEVVAEAMNWGLLTAHEIGGGYLRLQPILPYFLRQRLHDPAQAAFRAAVETAFRAHYDVVGGALAQLSQSKQPQERQVGLTLTNLEYENLMTALNLALAQRQSFWNLYNNLAQYLRIRQAFREEKAICERILAWQEQYPPESLAGEIGGDFFQVYGNLGTMNLQLKLYAEAEQTYKNALELIPQLKAISEAQRGNWLGTAYHQLGVVAQEQRQWETAVSHYQQALQIKIEFNDRYSQASIYHNLGMVAQEQRQWETAESHYQQALQIKIESNDRYSQASTYHNLGAVAQEQRQWGTAESHYQQALQIFIEFNDRYSQARTYHQLGIVAQEQRQWGTAEAHYQQALQIKIEFNDRYSQASTYHQLGIVAQEQRQWGTAEAHYQQALPIYVEFNDRYSQASTYHQLGRVAQAQQQWGTAEFHYQQALQIKIEFNDRYSQASTYHQLGRVAQAQQQWGTAESHYRQALQIKIEFNDHYSQASTYGQLGLLAEAQEKWAEAANYLLQALEIFAAFDDRHDLDIALRSMARVWQAAQSSPAFDQTAVLSRLATILHIPSAQAQSLLEGSA